MKDETLHPLYYNLIRIQTADQNESDWFGWFGGSGIVEGFGYKVVLHKGIPTIVPVKPSPKGGNYMSRFLEKQVSFSTIEDFVIWSRLYDQKGDFPISGERIVVPCLRTSRMTYEASLTEPEYGSVQRTIVTFTPVLKDNMPDVDISFIDETEAYRKARVDEYRQKVLNDIAQSLEE